MSERLLPPREACRRLGIHFVTLKRWIYSGKIRAVRTPSGRWMIPESEIERIVSGKAETRETKAVIYARVSSSDQKADLERQIQYLTQYCLAKGYRVVDVLSDVASGLRADRKGLLKLFDYVVNKQVDVVVVTHRDRLTRFGFEYLDYFFRQFGIRVETIYGEVPVDERQELVEDLIAVVIDFANRLYGVGSRRKRRLVDGFRKLLEEVEENG